MSPHHDHVPAHPAKRRMSPFVIAVLALGMILVIALAIGIVGSQPPSPDELATDAAEQMFPDGTESTEYQHSTAGDATSDTAKPVAATPATKPASTSANAAPTAAEIAAAKAAGTQRATIVTKRGTMVCELYGADAPLTVANFTKLAKAKFYNGLTFHRVEPNFVIQGGDPNGDGSGGPGYSIDLEISPKLRHIDGALAMARSQHPDSAGSQFYITIGAQSFLDDNYAVFGKVVSGLDVAKKVVIGDTIESITIE